MAIPIEVTEPASPTMEVTTFEEDLAPEEVLASFVTSTDRGSWSPFSTTDVASLVRTCSRRFGLPGSCIHPPFHHTRFGPIY